jgi:hypothetical protein
LLGASLIYLGERVAGSDEKEKRGRKKSSFQCHATLHTEDERTDSLKALDSVAIYLENGNF